MAKKSAKHQRKLHALIAVAVSLVLIALVSGVILFFTLSGRSLTPSVNKEFTLRVHDKAIIKDGDVDLRLKIEKMKSEKEDDTCGTGTNEGICAPGQSITTVLQVNGKPYKGVAYNPPSRFDMTYQENTGYQTLPYELYVTDTDFKTYAKLSVKKYDLVTVQYDQQFTLRNNSMAVLAEASKPTSVRLSFDNYEDGSRCPSGDIYINNTMEYFSNFMSTEQACRMQPGSSREAEGSRLTVVDSDNRSYVIFVFERVSP